MQLFTSVVLKIKGAPDTFRFVVMNMPARYNHVTKQLERFFYGTLFYLLNILIILIKYEIIPESM